MTPSDRVLDVGCGAGRLAGPLTGYLDPSGSYEGFDSSAERIEWCNENIAPHHPGFRFPSRDVHNGQYNPEPRRRRASTPSRYGDGEFDVVVLTSVFTHMLPDDVAHYLDEIARVLKPGGRALITLVRAERGDRAPARGAARPPARSGHERARSTCVTRLRRLPDHEPACAGARGRVLRALGPGRLRAQRARDRRADALRRLGRAHRDAPQPGRGPGAAHRASASSPSTSAGISRAMRERGTTRSNPASSASPRRVDVDVRVEAEQRRRPAAGAGVEPAVSRSTITRSAPPAPAASTPCTISTSCPAALSVASIFEAKNRSGASASDRVPCRS